MEQFEDKYHQYLNGEDAHETEWSDEDKAMQDFLEQASQLKVPGAVKSKAEIWQSITDEIADEPAKEVKTIQWGWICAIAASVMLLLVAGMAFFNSTDNQQELISHIVGEQALEVVALPDGSCVSMNSVSLLSYAKSDEQWNRTLDLKGEAFFQVKKGETFTVNTEFGTVKVLGTSFNVSTRNDVFAVSCKTGRVEVSFKDPSRPSEMLTKGQTVVFEKNEVQRKLTDTEKIGQWYEGTFHYEGRPVMEAFNEIERQYDIELEYEDKTIASRLFEGYFYKEDLNTSLSMICDAMGLSYTVEGRVVTIESNSK